MKLTKNLTSTVLIEIGLLMVVIYFPIYYKSNGTIDWPFFVSVLGIVMLIIGLDMRYKL